MNAAEPSWYDEAEACSRLQWRAGTLHDIATALPVSAGDLAVLEPDLTVAECAHVGTILDEVRRLLGERTLNGGARRA